MENINKNKSENYINMDYENLSKTIDDKINSQNKKIEYLNNLQSQLYDVQNKLN